MIAEEGLDLVRSFLTVAEELNFRRSAERLNIDQSALTRRIQRLEEAVGFKLLERTTRQVILTQAGQSFYRDNQHLLARYAESVTTARRIADGKAGRLRVGYMAFAAPRLMPAAVARFRCRHPNVDLHLRYIRTQGQKLALAGDEIDVGFMIGPFDHSEYHSLTLASDPLCLVAPPGHPLLGSDRIRPADLAGEDLILGDMQEWGEFRWRIDDMFDAEGVRPKVRLEASNTLAISGLVAAGLGVTLFPESLVGVLGATVEARPLDAPGFRIGTVLVWKRLNRSAMVREFVEVASQPSEGRG